LGHNKKNEKERHTPNQQQSPVSAKYPLIAGPIANPNKAVVISGAIVLARFNGVDISDKNSPDPTEVMAPPTLVMTEHATREWNELLPMAYPRNPKAPTVGPITTMAFSQHSLQM
jgi:hypothetical protein